MFVITGLLLIAGLFFKKGEYNVDFEIIVNKPSKQVFDFIKYLKNQDNFSVWVNVDAGMKKSYGGVDGTVGFISAWDKKTKMQE